MPLVASGLVLTALILLIPRLLVQRRPRDRSHGSTVGILKRRYASGEIMREGCDSICRDLLP